MVKGPELNLLFETTDDFRLPAGDSSWGDLYSKTHWWLAGARLTIWLITFCIILLKKHYGRRLYLNALLVLVAGFGLLSVDADLRIAEGALGFMSLFSERIGFNLGFMFVFLFSFGALFLFINTAPVRQHLLAALKKPFFGRFRVPWQNPLSPEAYASWQRFDLKSKSGATIRTIWHPAENARGTIVLGHPMGKAAKGMFLKNGHAQRLIDLNFNVMLLDINGFGESSMGSFNFYHDIEAAALKARELSGDLLMGYHGLSLGGMWVCPVLSKELNPFSYVILESAATTLPEFWRHYPTAYKLLKLSFAFIPKHAEYLKPIKHVPHFKGVEKLLLIYSDGDEYTPLEMGERFKEAAQVPAELWNPSGADHALAFKSHADEYWQRVIGFFDENINHA